MTTAAQQPRTERHPARRVGVLTGTFAGVTVAVLVGAAIGALVAGSAAAYAVLLGGALVLGTFGLGAAAVNTVAGVMPGASLLVALLTYLLQLVVLWMVLAGLDTSALLLDGTLDRTWLGATVILGALVWVGAQLALAVTRRIPAYDLPEAGA